MHPASTTSASKIPKTVEPLPVVDPPPPMAEARVSWVSFGSSASRGNVQGVRDATTLAAEAVSIGAPDISTLGNGMIRGPASPPISLPDRGMQEGPRYRGGTGGLALQGLASAVPVIDARPRDRPECV